MKNQQKIIDTLTRAWDQFDAIGAMGVSAEARVMLSPEPPAKKWAWVVADLREIATRMDAAAIDIRAAADMIDEEAKG